MSGTSKGTILGSDRKYIKFINMWKAGLKNGMRGKTGTSKYIRRYLFEKYDSACSECRWAVKNPYTNTVLLEIEHIDGDYKNNKENNLKLLCPNCHSLTSTYKALNKGKGRETRRNSSIGRATAL